MVVALCRPYLFCMSPGDGEIVFREEKDQDCPVPQPSGLGHSAGNRGAQDCVETMSLGHGNPHFNV